MYIMLCNAYSYKSTPHFHTHLQIATAGRVQRKIPQVKRTKLLIMLITQSIRPSSDFSKNSYYHHIHETVSSGLRTTTLCIHSQHCTMWTMTGDVSAFRTSLHHHRVRIAAQKSRKVCNHAHYLKHHNNSE